MRGNMNAIEAAEADQRAAKVEQALKDIEQAGRGLVKVRNQLGTGVPQGNELHYLITIQGFVNSAMFELSELGQQQMPAEPPAPKIEIG